MRGRSGAVTAGVVDGRRASSGRGSVYAALDRGRIDIARLWQALVSVPLPRAADGRLVLTVDTTVDLDAAEAEVLWQAFLRRFDIEHTFRMLKQTIGWTFPKLRNPDAADRWTWLLLAAYTQLRLARNPTVDLRRPWDEPVVAQRLTPARVRRGFRRLRRKAACPARAPKPSRPGTGRSAGHRNQRVGTPLRRVHQDRQ
ncbi:hypothetical protein [Nocardia carnea]|uniref:hypothetical protein n=1 Tax=Nocardia carnea TaxID=37328 RepID=UPI0024550A2B|nr:hypothetical protein [Nocardia carnea]